MSRYFILFVWLSGLSHASDQLDSPRFFSENLLKNGGYESWAKQSTPGWTARANGGNATVSTDRMASLSGVKSLKISLPESDSGGQVISWPVPVSPGKSYLFSISFRQEGMSIPKEGRYNYAGVSSSVTLSWQDENRQALPGAVLMAFPYGPSPWDIRDALVTAPPSARYATVTASISNMSAKESGSNIPSALWLDAAQLREYSPPATPASATEKAPLLVDGYLPDTEVKTFFPGSDSTWHSKNGQWSKSITDEKTERGGALKAEAFGSQGIMAHSPYYTALTPGLYRVIAKVAVSDPASVGEAGFIDVQGQYSGDRAKLQVVPNQFPAAGEYMSIERDFVVRDAGWWSLRPYTEGKTEWRIDSIRVFPLATFSDTTLIDIYPGCEGAVPEHLKPVRTATFKSLVVAGVGWDRLKIQDMLRLTSRDISITPVWLQRQSGYKLLGWPETAEDLFEHNAVFLCNIPSSALSILQKNLLKEYVKRGGLLVLFGGHLSYERSEWKGSLLDDLFPIKIEGTPGEGLQLNTAGWPVNISSSLPWKADYGSAKPPLVYALHRSVAKPDTQVLASAGGFPFLCSRSYGAGSVIACLGAPLGYASTKDEMPFWEWDEWAYLMRDTLLSAINR